MIADILRDSVVDKIIEDVQELEHELKFVNVGGNKWQAQFSFDLDESSMSESQKAIVSELLKYL